MEYKLITYMYQWPIYERRLCKIGYYFLYVVCGRIEERKKVYGIIMKEKEVYW